MEQTSEVSKEETSEQILRFFRQHKEEWRSFVSDFLPVTPHPPLQALAKFFVIRSNQPFDMQAYMKAQAEFIKNSLDGSLDSSTPLERQKLVAEWLRHNAQVHGKATQVELDLIEDGIIIRDDGVGVEGAIVEGTGMKTIRFRADQLECVAELRNHGTGAVLSVKAKIR